MGCSIEQDAAYWEWQIERTSGGSADDGDDDDDDDDNAPKFGVATRKDQKFYRALQAAEIDGESPSYLVAQFVYFERCVHFYFVIFLAHTLCAHF